MGSDQKNVATEEEVSRVSKANEKMEQVFPPSLSPFLLLLPLAHCFSFTQCASSSSSSSLSRSTVALHTCTLHLCKKRGVMR
eukprot:522807-Rhodomonas_salina.2